MSFVMFHSSMTIFYNFPMTPFKEKYVNIIHGYMHPLFNQTWTLFAPNPVNINIKVEAKLAYENEKETNWINFSDIIFEETKNSYLTHYQFYNRVLIQTQNDVVNASESIMLEVKESNNRLLKEHEDLSNTQAFIENLIENDIENFLNNNKSVDTLYKLVYNYFENRNVKGISEIQLRLSSEFFPEYGKSDDSKYRISYLPKLNVKQLVEGG
ncbi:hypothetical protein CKF48_09090 [Cytobacillus kochii]|uniref:Uncharacterized protein n=2 Tax=Cytobacillus kochii TaxID=859143 RepID=A0A248THA4_9BACI|nr:hypothetical protein CKF48_09090 [Cytobacillus kochii]